MIPHIYRALLFRTFVVLFLVTAGGVLFYAFGYRFSGVRGIFLSTGSITLNTNPQNVTVLVDGQPFPSQRLRFINNTLHLAGINPGEHFVEVSAPGFRTWQKQVTVHSGLSTEFWNVVLIHDAYEITFFPDIHNAIKVFPAPIPNLFAVVSSDEGTHRLSVSLVTTPDVLPTEAFSVSSDDYRFQPDVPENIEWGPNAQHLSIPLLDTHSGIVEYFIINVNSDSGFSAKLSALSGTSDRRSVRWNPTKDGALLSLSGTNLFSMVPEEMADVHTGSVPELLAKDVLAYDISGSSFFTVDTNGTVWKRSLTNNADAEQITKNELPADALSKNSSLIVYDDDRITYLNRDTGRLFLLNWTPEHPNFTELADHIRGTQFSDDGKKLLFFTDNEISVTFLKDWTVQPIRSAGDAIQIARFAEPIRFVQWSDDYEHALFTLDKTVKYVELDPRGERSIVDILSLPATPRQLLSNTQTTRSLFFIAPASDPSDPVFSFIRFPEPTGIFQQ